MTLSRYEHKHQQLHDLQQKITEIRQRIQLACQKAGRKPEDIRLLPVTKTLPVQLIQLAYQLGFHYFGENKVLEAKAKHETLHDLPIQWILIGHLQSNKVKYVAKFIDEFHALDSIKLADKLHQRLLVEKRQLPVYIQVNTSGEISKYGVEPQHALALVEQCQQFSQLKVVGLMTLAIHSQNSVEVRRCFKTLRQLKEQIQHVYPDVQRLSMGMSGDFEIAIEEGATDIRVGQAIFGARDLPDSYYWQEN